MRVLGLMSGTSVDSIDVAACEFWPDPARAGGLAMRLLGYCEQPYPDELRGLVLAVAAGAETSAEEIAHLSVALGQAYGCAAREGARSLGLSLESIDLITSHGQSVYHLTEPKRPATLQLAEPACIAAATGRTVVANFRTADLAAGGQGAPLVSFFDVLFFGGDGKTRAVQNIGGIGNVTFVSGDAPLAFDTGPGNMLVDFAARQFSDGALRFDRDGAMAAAGTADPDLLEEVLSHPYFSRRPPKTTGRELFGDAFAGELLRRAAARSFGTEDTMATITAITAESIARAYREFGPARLDEVIVAGGGARNPSLLGELRRRLPGIPVLRHDDTGVPGDAKEAVAFALLGHEAIHGRPGNVPACTGASHHAILGQITPGDNFSEVMRRALREENQWDRTLSLRLLP